MTSGFWSALVALGGLTVGPVLAVAPPIPRTEADAARAKERDAQVQRAERLAEVSELAGDLRAAVMHRQAAMKPRQRLEGDRHWRTADARLTLHFARKAAALGEADRAEALAIRHKVSPANHSEVAASLNRLALVYCDLQRFETARKTCEEVLAISRKDLRVDRPDIALTLSNLGLTLNALGQHQEPLKSLEEALAIYRKVLPNDHPDIALSLAALRNPRRHLRQYLSALRTSKWSIRQISVGL